MIYILAIFLPLVGAIISGFFGPLIKNKGAQFVTCGSLLLSAIFSLLILNDVALQQEPKSIQLFSWIISADCCRILGRCGGWGENVLG